MAIIVNSKTGFYWRPYGGGETNKLAEAHRYSNGQAEILIRLYPGTHYIENDKNPMVWLQHEYVANTRNSPARTQYMKDNSIVWVQLDGAWAASDVQALAKGSLMALNYDPEVTGGAAA